MLKKIPLKHTISWLHLDSEWTSFGTGEPEDDPHSDSKHHALELAEKSWELRD